MYKFIASMYIRGKITADRVRSYSPRYITYDEAEQIIQSK